VLGPRLGTLSVEQQSDDCYRVRVGDRVWLTHDPSALVPILEGAVERHSRPGANPLRRARGSRRVWPTARLRGLLARRRRSLAASAPVERKAMVFGTSMSYLEAGKGPPVVFLHGGAASAAMWRRVLPLLPSHRCIAVDLIGTGHSDRIRGADAEAYTWQEHSEYLAEFLDVVGVTRDVTLVMHGWSPLVVYPWALEHRDRLRGLAFVEAIVAPFGYGDLDEPLRDAFLTARSDKGYRFVVESGTFFDRVIDSQTLEPLEPSTSASYRRTTHRGRLALYAAINGLPIGGEPRDAVELAQRGNAWLCESALPKLVVLGRPGTMSSVIPNETLTRAPNLTLATTRGRHLLADESPESLALCLKMWLSRLDANGHTKRR
jgi:haloalkane dehalogenase